ncbi:hypothetical protein AKUH4B114J_02490 [Apilactobacillus kunkeei]|uniref:AbiH family protein n=1 Tax=Apilactobacillus kunkeei TaxID=148814 RepID=UPI001C6F7184|nr:AbiH family protein [Apilactobacillus kunkeei]MBX8455127.1 bacteriophage abortive infection AbiH family protein [Apilactobacillus kunkeei]QYU54662.1 bacteriophage abortive infection AbiH family protein [Apilactobacillus kunkeei]CAI2564374.1 hypothetical protein AKUH3B101X_02480 [Apilactobacillus kunkeei]CAI2564867.1 hypothetical protein AKUH2B105J_02480 [Apilactobacillus kunkeei]CAI2564917.1 hypothetical protein AKUH3B206M_02480 [Apilactobacillus kunkeei]
MEVRTLLITGNGLDLKSELKSTYFNFFSQKNKIINDLYHFEKIYDSLFITTIDEEVNTFEEDLHNRCLSIYMLEKWMEQYYFLNAEDNKNKDSIELDENVSQFFNHIQNVLKNNDYSYWLLPNVMKQEISKNWNGIEEEMSKYIHELSKGNDFMSGFKELKTSLEHKCFKNNKEDDSEDGEKNGTKDSSKEDSCVNFNLFMIIAGFVFRNKDIIIKRAEDKFRREIDLNPEIEDYIKNEFFESVININIDEFLISELNKLEDLFSDYLKYEVDRKDYKNNVIKNIYNIVGLEPVNILNFNYTDYGNYLKNCDLRYRINLNKIFNIHGSLNDHIIFGIDNSPKDFQCKNIHVPMFTKTYRIMSRTSKAKMFESNDRFYNNDISYLADQSYDVIKFFGHSLSGADYSYFQSIFDKLDLYNSAVILEFYYSNHRKDNEYPDRDMHKVENNVFSLLSRYGETLDNKSRGNNLMHKLLVEGRLVIKELK